MSTGQPPMPAERPQPTAPRSYHFPRFERATLHNGLRLVVAPVSKLPLVTVLAIVDAGAVAEPADKQGVAVLTAQLLLEGAGQLDGAALADRFERIGASVDSSADWDVAAVSLTALTAQLPEALALVRDLLRTPTFPEREVSRLREERLAELLQQRAEPGTLADEQFSCAVYAPTARYAAPVSGDVASVRGLQRDDVLAFYQERFHPGATTIVFAGDVTMTQARALADSLFGDWTGARPPASAAPVDTAQPGALTRIIAKVDAPQSELRLGHLGIPRSAPDYFDAVVMNAVLGGLFSSRINLNLREAHGYTYGAFSSFDWRRGRGPFTVSTAVKSDVTAEAVKEILLEIDRMRREEIDETELTLATSYLDGVFPIRYETTSAIAAALANLVIHELPGDYYDRYRERVRAVTTAGVLRAAQAHLHPDALRIVIVGDPATIAEPLRAVVGAVEVVTPDVAEAAR
ncbi:MAG: peptidase domain protein [Gemmatimonadetes bacterium]|nr:peptidase domain protein [Gemmatimonadota bacterium]